MSTVFFLLLSLFFLLFHSLNSCITLTKFLLLLSKTTLLLWPLHGMIISPNQSPTIETVVIPRPQTVSCYRGSRNWRSLIGNATRDRNRTTLIILNNLDLYPLMTTYDS